MLSVGSGLYKYANMLEEVPEGTSSFEKFKHIDEPVWERFLDHFEYVRIDQVLTALENERTFQSMESPQSKY